MSHTDLRLLERYAGQQDQDAFAEIVSRHLDLVFSAALRQVRSPQLAEEVAQSVFTDLARQTDHLAPDTILTAWLYQVTRRTAIDVVRREARRQVREQVALEMTAMNSVASDWTRIDPLLDEAMHTLDEADRTAVLLRYFENKSLREVGQVLGATEEAARKRVSRAVERLREFFNARGVTVTTSGLLAVISAQAVQAAPAGLGPAVSATALLAGTSLTTTAPAAKAMAMTTLQKMIVTGVLVTSIGAGLHQARQASSLRDQVQSLEQAQATLSNRLQFLQRERDDATNRLALLMATKSRVQIPSAEVTRLRAEAAALRSRLAAKEADYEKLSSESIRVQFRPRTEWGTRATKTPSPRLRPCSGRPASRNQRASPRSPPRKPWPKLGGPSFLSNTPP